MAQQEKTRIELLNEKIDIAWEAYLLFLEEHKLPLPYDMESAKLYFRGGFVFCMAIYYQDVVN